MGRLALGSQSYARNERGMPPEELVNLYPETTDQVSDEAFNLVSTPGLNFQTTVGVGPVKALFQEEGFLNGSIFTVSGGELWESAFGTMCDFTTLNNTLIGNVGNVGGFAYLDALAGNQLIIVNDGRYFVYDGTTLTEQLPAALPVGGATSLAVLDQRAVFSGPGNNGQFGWSDVLAPAVTPGLNFATAERRPDRLSGLREYGDELWLFGPSVIEVHYGTGSATLPFARRDGVTIDYGVRDFGTVSKINNGLVFQDVQNRIFSVNGYASKRISTHGVEEFLDDPLCTLEPFSWTYGKEGHEFYGITYPGQFTFVFDVATNRWHRRTSPGLLDYRVRTVRTICCLLVAGDNYSGNLYILNDAISTDNGAEIEREFTTNVETYDRQPFPALALDIVTGLGPSSAAPQITLEISDDRGRTYKPAKAKSLGTTPYEALRVIWRRLGTSRRYGRVFKFKCKGVNVTISNAELEGQER